MHKTATCLLGLLLGACSTTPEHANIAEIYKDAALNEVRNPVIVIHGILGARLAQRSTGKTVWGAFTSDTLDPDSKEGARAIALPLEPPACCTDYDPEQEDVYAAGPLTALKVSILFNIISVKIYANIIRALGAGGYTDPIAYEPLSPRYADDHFTCYTFFYDWRRDNVQNAVALHKFIQESRKEIDRRAMLKIKKLRQEGSEESIMHATELLAWLGKGYRFDIVAHSMGGLLARYYLRYGAADLPEDGTQATVTWAGSKEVDRMILVGTPNLGSIDSLRQLQEGFKPGFLLPRYHKALLGSMASIYQLLPRSRHGVLLDSNKQAAKVDLMDPEVWRQNGWGLMDKKADKMLQWLLPEAKTTEERRDKAYTYLQWCLERARLFHAAMDKKPENPCPSRIYLFASGSRPTLTRALLKKKGDRLLPSFGNSSALLSPGDETVPRYSAVGDEREGKPFQFGLQSNIPWTNKTFLSGDHLGLTMNAEFTDNMLHILLEEAPSQ